MMILLAILTVSCISWIVTKEAIFADLRAWSTGKRGLYPLSCPFCLCPWVAALVVLTQHIQWIYFFPVVWVSYHSLSVYQRVRGA